MNPLVSILIPAHNAEPWIAEAIQSALSQTWQRREIIVVDDGSSDRTLEVAESFATQGVRVVTGPNRGAAAARNTAISLSRGDYIQWLDADDLLAPEKIALQIDALRSCPNRRTLLSGEWAHFYYRTRRAEFQPTPLWQNLTPVEWLLLKLGQNYYMQPGTWLVSRELTDAAGPWDTRLWRDNDGEYFCRVVLASEGIRFVPGAKVYYRRSGFNCITHIGRSNTKLESLFLSMQLHVQYLRSLEDSERVRTACLNYLQNWLVYFAVDRPDIAYELQRLAASLGGTLHSPQMSWKYEALRAVLGRTATHRIWSVAPMSKQSLLRAVDYTFYRLENARDRDRATTPPAYGESYVRWTKVTERSVRLSSLLAGLIKAAEQFWT